MRLVCCGGGAARVAENPVEAADLGGVRLQIRVSDVEQPHHALAPGPARRAAVLRSEFAVEGEGESAEGRRCKPVTGEKARCLSQGRGKRAGVGSMRWMMCSMSASVVASSVR